jgi:hypothetical protein
MMDKIQEESANEQFQVKSSLRFHKVSIVLVVFICIIGGTNKPVKS